MKKNRKIRILDLCFPLLGLVCNNNISILHHFRDIVTLQYTQLPVTSRNKCIWLVSRYSSNSSITTKHLHLILTFRSHHEIFIRRSWYSTAYAFWFMCKHIVINTCYFPQSMLERFQTAKVAFKVTQGHCCWCHSIGHVWLSIILPL